MFRQRSSGTPAGDVGPAPPTTVHQARQPSKGRPTPKRSEAERRRRQPVAAQPADRKAAAAKRRADYQRKRAAARRGEEWALRPADRGPVRALARDYIDSRRLIVSEYVLFVAFIAILAILFTGAAANSIAVLYVEVGIIALISAETLYHARRVTRLAKARLPGESTRGVAWYVAKRSIRLRMSREPQARVERGEAI